MTRIIEDWSEAAIKEIKHADDIGETAWTLIPRINSHSGEYKNIGRMILNCEDENTIVQDISDYFCRDAKFPEQKYYVKLIRNNDISYLNRSTSNGFCTTSVYQPDVYQPDEVFQTEFTEQEIKDIDPRYMAFAVPVEE